MRDTCRLPDGRKSYYYEQYVADMLGCAKIASLRVFMEAWSTLPWLTVEKCLTSFKKCSICTFLRAEAAKIPRNMPDLLNAYKARLSKHYAFQGAQRTKMNLIEAYCKNPAQRTWTMLADKMDQQKTNVPCIWDLMASSLFHDADRVVVGLIGSAWSGPASIDMLVRTVFDDTKHGAEQQCSTYLLNFLYAVEKEGYIPKEWVINADNTPKETKNTCMMWWSVWLLCILHGTPLTSVLFGFLLVGHTHNRLDRFFGRVARSMRGRDYMSVEEMQAIVNQACSAWHIQWVHQTHVWNWESLGEHLPKFHNLATVHAINIFRAGGIWIKWKMFMTDETWSRPVLLVPAKEIPNIAALRPDRLEQTMFNPDQKKVRPSAKGSSGGFKSCITFFRQESTSATSSWRRLAHTHTRRTKSITIDDRSHPAPTPTHTLPNYSRVRIKIRSHAPPCPLNPG